MAITAMSAGAAYENGRKTANGQADAIKRADELQAMDTVRQQSQIAAQGAEATHKSVQAAQASLASFDAIAGEYGSGNSVDRSRSTLGIQSSEATATVQGNAVAALNESAVSAYANRSRNLSQLGAISRPSVMLAGLQIGGAALEGYDRFDRYKASKAPKSPVSSKTGQAPK